MLGSVPSFTFPSIKLEGEEYEALINVPEGLVGAEQPFKIEVLLNGRLFVPIQTTVLINELIDTKEPVQANTEVPKEASAEKPAEEPIVVPAQEIVSSNEAEPVVIRPQESFVAGVVVTVKKDNSLIQDIANKVTKKDNSILRAVESAQVEKEPILKDISKRIIKHPVHRISEPLPKVVAKKPEPIIIPEVQITRGEVVYL